MNDFEYRVTGGIVFVFILSLLVFFIQIYSCSTKRLIEGTKSKYSGVLDNYEESKEYILKVQLVLQILILLLTLFVGGNIILNYSNKKIYWGSAYFFFWLILQLFSEKVQYLLIKNKYYEYYE